MIKAYLLKYLLLISSLSLLSLSVSGQQVENVTEAFKSLPTNPEVICIKNNLEIPVDGGHLQGVQLIEKNRSKKLLISGSSSTEAYIVRFDLANNKTDKLIPLMNIPYKHAGGIQVIKKYLIVGIEDNELKTTSKVCLYNFIDNNLEMAEPTYTIHREGEVKKQTAGATGLLNMDHDYLAVVSNWDSRNWDFYRIDPAKGEHELILSFEAPKNWAAYQSINLIKDSEAVYAIGFYGDDRNGYADLILVSKLENFRPIMKKLFTKTFNCKKEVDFNTAVGLQIDNDGKLHIWATQRNASKSIFINRFGQD